MYLDIRCCFTPNSAERMEIEYTNDVDEALSETLTTFPSVLRGVLGLQVDPKKHCVTVVLDIKR